MSLDNQVFKKLSIVTSLYQSQDFIQEFYARIQDAAQKVALSYQLVFVNDGSPDKSLEIVLKIAAKNPNVEVIDLSRNFGHHQAIMTGIEYASGDAVFVIDVDLEEPPELLIQFAKELTSTNVEIVYGVQHKRKGDILERVSGFVFYWAFNQISSIKIPKNVAMARLFTENYKNALLKFVEKDLFLAGITELVGFHQKTIPFTKISNGRTSYNFFRRIDLMLDSVTSFSGRPLYTQFYFGAFSLVISIIFVSYLILKYLFFEVAPGWTSVVASVWFFGSFILFSIGLVGIYLSKVFIEVKRRPRTIVATHTKTGSSA